MKVAKLTLTVLPQDERLDIEAVQDALAEVAARLPVLLDEHDLFVRTVDATEVVDVDG